MISLFGRRERARAVYYTIAITALVSFSNIMKLTYAAPRPFWSSDDVQAFHCSSEYGNPSGHTSISVGISMLVALDLIEDYVTETNVKVLVLATSLLFGASVGYSRLFLGVHGLNQVYFGALMGLWIALTIHYVLRNAVMHHLKSILSLDETRYSKLLITCFGFMFVMYTGMIQYTNSFEAQNLTEWSTRILEKCGAEELEEAFANYSLLSLGNANIGFGAYLGFLFSVYMTPELD